MKGSVVSDAEGFASSRGRRRRSLFCRVLLSRLEAPYEGFRKLWCLFLVVLMIRILLLFRVLY